MTFILVQNTRKYNRARQSTIILDLCHVKGGDNFAFILIIFYLLYQNILTSLNCKDSWKNITLLKNLQRQQKQVRLYFVQELQKEMQIKILLNKKLNTFSS